MSFRIGFGILDLGLISEALKEIKLKYKPYILTIKKQTTHILCYLFRILCIYCTSGMQSFVEQKIKEYEYPN